MAERVREWHIRHDPPRPTPLGDLLRFLRQSAHLSQTEVETTLGIASTSVSKFENGRRPSPSMLKALADLYEASYLTRTTMIECVVTERAKHLREEFREVLIG